uniref:Uncharacterized protein n=1 Tax=Rhizophora mucronata TaxID=61149 RepID=A0A2P2PJF2_RHIMU
MASCIHQSPVQPYLFTLTVIISSTAVPSLDLLPLTRECKTKVKGRGERGILQHYFKTTTPVISFPNPFKPTF